MTEILVRCPKAGCGASYRVDGSLRGKTGRCNKCGQKFPLVPPESAAPGGDGVAAVWQPGDVIAGLYEVKGVLGEGGMGKVYRVHHREWGVDLAVKSPRAELLARPGAREDFEREAEAWVHLGIHPHTVTCFYVRRMGEVPRVFAECVEGGSLRDWIDSQKLCEGGPERALKRILEIAIQFAWGLHHAHEQGLVHQDVKPHNVMMTPDGVAKVTDFGLAKARAVAGEAPAAPTRQTILVSSGGMTPAYCSPEQAEGRPLSRATDVWSWAVSVLEMFTGGVTWPSGTVAAEALEAHLASGGDDERFPPLHPEVAELLRKCLRRDPQERPRSMRDIATALAATVRNLQSEVEEVEPVEPTPAVEQSRADPARPFEPPADSLNNQAVSLLELGRLDAAVEKWSQALRVDPRHAEATYNLGLLDWRGGRLTAEQLLERLRTARDPGGQWLPVCLAARVHLEHGDPEAAIRILEQLPEEARQREQVVSLLSEAREHQAHAPRLARTLETLPEPVLVACLSADGRVAITADADPFVRVWEVASGSCRHTLRIAAYGDRSNWLDSMRLPASMTPDGRMALLLHRWSGELQVWNLQTGQRLIDFKPGGRFTRDVVALAPDGTRVAVASDNRPDVHAWKLADRSSVVFKGHTAEVTSLAFTPDGGHILSGGKDRTVRLWNSVNGQCLHTFTLKSAPVRLCVSGDSRHAAGVDADGVVSVWSLEGKQAIGQLRPHNGGALAVSLSRDGGLVLTTGKDRLAKLTELPAGRVIRTFTGHTDEVLHAALSGDGRVALSAGKDGSVHVWEVGRMVRVPVVLSRLQTSEGMTDAARLCRQEVAEADKAIERKEWIRAAELIGAARARPGCRRQAEAVERWESLYPRLPRGDFRGGWQVGSLGSPGPAITWLEWSADGRRILSLDTAGTLHLWDAIGGQVLAKFGGIAATTGWFAADASWFLAGEKDGTVGAWDAKTRACRWAFRSHTGAVTALAVTADCRHALSGEPEGMLKLWDVASGECLRSWRAHDTRVESLCLLPDDQHILSAGATFRLWDLVTGRAVREWPGAGGPATVDVSGDGRVAVACGPGRLVAWELRSDAPARKLFEGTDPSTAARQGRWVSLTSTGRYALSADGTGREMSLWDVTAGSCLHRFTGSESPVTAVCLRPDSGRAVSGLENGTIKVWFLDWTLEQRETADWDEAARPYLEAFLARHTPVTGAAWQFWLSAEEKVRRALTRQGRPRWNQADVEGLLKALGNAGLGWLRREGVCRELEKLAAAWLNRTSEG